MPLCKKNQLQKQKKPLSQKTVESNDDFVEGKFLQNIKTFLFMGDKTSIIEYAEPQHSIKLQDYTNFP